MVSPHWWVELDLVSLVGRTVSSGMFRGGWGLRKTLGSLSDDGWGCVLTLFVVWPETYQHWSLQAVGWGQVLVSQWQLLGELTPMSTPWTSATSVLVPTVSHSHTPASPGDPPRPAGRSGPGSYEVTAFSLGPCEHKTLCAPSKSGVSLSLSPVEPLWSSLQSQMLWGLLLLMPDPHAGESEVGLSTLPSVGESLRYIYFLVCG